MKRLKYFWPIVLIAVVALLGGCTQSKERGIAMAQDFVKAWSGDSAALAKQVESINAAVDSLTFKSPFVDAFIAEACCQSAAQRWKRRDWRAVRPHH